MKCKYNYAVVNISGHCPIEHRKLIEQASNYYLCLLMSKHIVRKITIDVKVIRSEKMEGDEGSCIVIDCDGSNNPRHFELELANKTNKKTLLYNLAHEIVHVKQFALRELNECQTKWCGKYYNDKKINYWDLPWEIDAYGRERGLYSRFIHKFNLLSIDRERLQS
jgi:hypothetical protein